MGWEGPVTNRQLNAWTEWFREEWNNPSRTDHYLMRIAAELMIQRLPEGRAISTDDLEIKFSFKNQKRKKSPRTQSQQKRVTNQKKMKGVVLGWAKSFGMVSVNSPEELQKYREEERRRQKERKVRPPLPPRSKRRPHGR